MEEHDKTDVSAISPNVYTNDQYKPENTLFFNLCPSTNQI